jgi:hypothetical protein
MNNVRLIGVTALMSVALSTSAATWIKTEAGTYDWNAPDNWLDGILPSATTDADLGSFSSGYRPTGNQTIAGNGSARTLDLNNKERTTVRTFTGDITASNLFVRIGKMCVDGTVELTGTDGTYSIIGGAGSVEANPGGVLDIRCGGVVRANGVHALCLGRRAQTDNTDTTGRVIVRDGGRLILNPSGSTGNLSGLMLGRLDGARSGIYSASYVQEGGEAIVGRIITGYENNTFASMAILGGSLDMPFISYDTRFRIGHKGYSTFQLFGGDVYAITNMTHDMETVANRYAIRNFTFEIGRGCSIENGLKGACFYGCGGTFTTKTDFSISGQGGEDDGDCAPAHATIDGSLSVAAHSMRIGANGSNVRASLNLNGGQLKTDFVFANPGRKGRSEINANGGKVVFDDSALRNQFLFLDAINIYEGGLEIQVDRSGGVMIGNEGTNVFLRTPGGYGVDIAGITQVGSNLTPPWVEISGGSGSNATAVSFVDYGTAMMTNAVVVCRGEGYLPGETPVATIYRPYGTTTLTDRIALSVSENRPGSFIKRGDYSLTLFAQPEFAGTYEVRQGGMIQSTAAGVASPKVRAVVVGGIDNATFQSASGNATATEANWNAINPAATLTLGTSYGPGKLAIPYGADGKPFEQTFASLSVSGTGNAIEKANGQPVNTAGVKLTFGTISCAEGSQLTIPNPKTDPTFKVYVTGMPTGTRFKNIVLAGTDKSVMIADDGQLVNATKSMTIIFK